MGNRKKVSEMTPIERMNKLMKGLSWEEAEEVGVEILARTFAFHAYSVKDGEKFFENLMEKIALRADEWAKEHSLELAMASVRYNLKKAEADNKKSQEKNDTNK